MNLEEAPCMLAFKTCAFQWRKKKSISLAAPIKELCIFSMLQ